MSPITTPPDRNLRNKIIDNGTVILTELLGAGSFGSVYRAHDIIHSSTVYAVKALKKAPPKPEAGREPHSTPTRDVRYDEEIHLHKKVSGHPNIVTVHRVVEEDDFIFVLMDLVDTGDLSAAIGKRCIYYRQETLLKKAFFQVMDAVEACHAAGIAHRDVKPDNILVSPDGAQIWLTDFGTATHREGSKDFAGTPGYRPPESLSLRTNDPRGARIGGKQHTHRVNDRWALGVLLLVMITCSSPWKYALTTADLNYLHFRNDPDYLRNTYPISPEANALIRRILDWDPAKRLSMGQMRKEVKKIDTFWLTDRQLPKAPGPVRDYAFKIFLRQSHYKPPRQPMMTVAERIGRLTMRHLGSSSKTLVPDTRPKKRILSPEELAEAKAEDELKAKAWAIVKAKAKAELLAGHPVPAPSPRVSESPSLYSVASFQGAHHWPLPPSGPPPAASTSSPNLHPLPYPAPPAGRSALARNAVEASLTSIPAAVVPAASTSRPSPRFLDRLRPSFLAVPPLTGRDSDTRNSTSSVSSASELPPTPVDDGPKQGHHQLRIVVAPEAHGINGHAIDSPAISPTMSEGHPQAHRPPIFRFKTWGARGSEDNAKKRLELGKRKLSSIFLSPSGASGKFLC